MTTIYQAKLANIAQAQFDKYRHFHETQAPLRKQIKTYWQDLKLGFTNVGVPWSAVFVSWCVKEAGATEQEFLFAQRHSIFVHQAIENAGDPQAVFIGRSITSYAPKIGDIVQNNRNGNTFDFAFAAANDSYASHSAIVVAVGSDAKGSYALTIGGNEGDTVGRRRIALTASGKIKQLSDNHFISIIETLK